jgi:beta-lactamase regulating signal transducer with metallopeptidase domain
MEVLMTKSDAISGFLINHLWQSTIFGLIALAAILILRRAPARVRYVLWIAISLKFLVPSAVLVSLASLLGLNLSSFFMTIAWASGDPISFLTRQNGLFYLTDAFSGSELHVHAMTFWTLIAIWLTGSAVLFIVWLRRQFSFIQILKRAAGINEGRESSILSENLQRMGIRKNVSLMSSSEVSEVGVWGMFRPVILLPKEISGQLSDSELEAIFLHELIHVARWDNLVSNVQMVICCLFWFHPIVWLVDRMLLSERERVCDDRVLQLGSASKTYASSLVKVLRFGLGVRIAGASCAGGSNLKRRIEDIVAGQANPRVSWSQKVLLGSMLLALFSFTIAAVKVDECEMDMLKKKLTVTKDACPNTAKVPVYKTGSSCPENKS